MAKRIRKPPRPEPITEEQKLLRSMDASLLRTRKKVENVIAFLTWGHILAYLGFLHLGLGARLSMWLNNLGPRNPHEYAVPGVEEGDFALLLIFTVPFVARWVGSAATDRIAARVLGGFWQQLAEVRLHEGGGESVAHSFWRTWNWAVLLVAGWMAIIVISGSSYLQVRPGGLTVNRVLHRSSYSWSQVSSIELRSSSRRRDYRNPNRQTRFYYVVTFRDDSRWKTRDSEHPYWEYVQQTMEHAKTTLAMYKGEP